MAPIDKSESRIYDYTMSEDSTIQLHAICEALDVADRDARYVLERGFIPQGVYVKPASGTHRQFSGGQAYWLGLVLKLKATGIKTPLAAKIADYATRSIQTITQNLNWEFPFLPTQGRLKTTQSYKVEIADLKHIRIGTDSGPSVDGFEWFDWHLLTKPARPCKDVQPFVVISFDLSLLAARLEKAFASAQS
jgi:hypothetical protein